MKIRVVTGDPTMGRLCREVLLQLPRREWNLTVSERWEASPDADLLIVDFHAGSPFPEEFDAGQCARTILLVAQRDVARLSKPLLGVPLRILLKPVNARLLRTFLEPAVLEWEDRHRTEPPDAEKIRLERDYLLQSLLQANLRLQEHELSRNRAVLNSENDVCSSLMSIEGYCDLLLQGELGSLTMEQIRVLERLRQSAKRLCRISAALFQFAAGPEQSSIRIGFASFEDCVRDAVSEVDPLAKSRRVEIEIDQAPPTEELLFDSTRLGLVLISLLENAVRTSRKGGRVTLKAHPVFWDRRSPEIVQVEPPADRRQTSSHRPNAYRVEIRDFAPAVPVGDLEKLSRERAFNGSGRDLLRNDMALAVCRDVITAHQGRVFAESHGEGLGVVFLLPYTRREPGVIPQVVPVRSKQVVSGL